MSTKKTNSQLLRWDDKFNELKRSLLEMGYVCLGSVVKRYMPCGKVGCHCMTNIESRHGPYYEWSTKLRGKSVTLRLTKEEADYYKEFTKNNQRLRKICNRMRSLSMKVAREKRRNFKTG